MLLHSLQAKNAIPAVASIGTRPAYTARLNASPAHLGSLQNTGALNSLDRRTFAVLSRVSCFLSHEDMIEKPFGNLRYPILQKVHLRNMCCLCLGFEKLSHSTHRPFVMPVIPFAVDPSRERSTQQDECPRFGHNCSKAACAKAKTTFAGCQTHAVSAHCYLTAGTKLKYSGGKSHQTFRKSLRRPWKSCCARNLHLHHLQPLPFAM